MCSWKLFSLRFKKQKLKAEQSAGKSGESALFVCVHVCVCVRERERDRQSEQDICEVMPHEFFSVFLALFWRDEGHCGRDGGGGGVAGDKTNSWTWVDRTNSDLTSKKVKNVHSLK